MELESRRKRQKGTWVEAGRILLLKVKSRQEEDNAKPNSFCASAHEIADKATHIAKEIDQYWKVYLHH